MSVKNRAIIKKMHERGWTHSITGKSHIKFVYGKTGAVVIHSGTPSDTRSEKNLLARAKRAEEEAT
jgi:predicted RNA binding protein YcfA (HicA-like mRNA interferase family)